MYAYVLYKGLAYSVSFQLVTENISVMIKYFLVSVSIFTFPEVANLSKKPKKGEVLNWMFKSWMQQL